MQSEAFLPGSCSETSEKRDARLSDCSTFSSEQQSACLDDGKITSSSHSLPSLFALHDVRETDHCQRQFDPHGTGEPLWYLDGSRSQSFPSVSCAPDFQKLLRSSLNSYRTMVPHARTRPSFLRATRRTYRELCN